MGALCKLGGTEKYDSPEAKKIRNDFKAIATGMSVDRAKRNWFERMIPLQDGGPDHNTGMALYRIK